MKTTLKTIGAGASEGKFDYFEFAKKNPDKGRKITHQEALKKIQFAQSEKLKKAS